MTRVLAALGGPRQLSDFFWTGPNFVVLLRLVLRVGMGVVFNTGRASSKKVAGSFSSLGSEQKLPLARIAQAFHFVGHSICFMRNELTHIAQVFHYQKTSRQCWRVG